MAFKMKGSPMKRNFGLNLNKNKDVRKARKADKKLEKGVEAERAGKFKKAEKKFKKMFKKLDQTDSNYPYVPGKPNIKRS